MTVYQNETKREKTCWRSCEALEVEHSRAQLSTMTSRRNRFSALSSDRILHRHVCECADESQETLQLSSVRHDKDVEFVRINDDGTSCSSRRWKPKHDGPATACVASRAQHDRPRGISLWDLQGQSHVGVLKESELSQADRELPRNDPDEFDRRYRTIRCYTIPLDTDLPDGYQITEAPVPDRPAHYVIEWIGSPGHVPLTNVQLSSFCNTLWVGHFPGISELSWTKCQRLYFQLRAGMDPSLLRRQPGRDFLCVDVVNLLLDLVECANDADTVIEAAHVAHSLMAKNFPSLAANDDLSHNARELLVDFCRGADDPETVLTIAKVLHDWNRTSVLGKDMKK